MSEKIKIMPDGFVWRVLSSDEARALWETNAFALYELNEDGSESLIATNEGIDRAIRGDIVVGLEVGFLSKSIDREKRRYELAMAAMQGIISSNDLFRECKGSDDIIAHRAVDIAEEMIKALKR